MLTMLYTSRSRRLRAPSTADIQGPDPRRPRTVSPPHKRILPSQLTSSQPTPRSVSSTRLPDPTQYGEGFLDDLSEEVLDALVNPQPIPRNAEYFDLGPLQTACVHCGALHWLEECKTGTVRQPQFTLCCNNGQIVLPPFGSLPGYLYELLHSPSPEAREFRNNIRAYNAAFAFTSLDCTATDRGVTGPGI